MYTKCAFSKLTGTEQPYAAETMQAAARGHYQQEITNLSSEYYQHLLKDLPDTLGKPPNLRVTVCVHYLHIYYHLKHSFYSSKSFFGIFNILYFINCLFYTIIERKCTQIIHFILPIPQMEHPCFVISAENTKQPKIREKKTCKPQNRVLYLNHQEEMSSAKAEKAA